ISYTAGAGPSVTIDLTVTDANGCSSSCQEIVTVTPCITVNLEIPGLIGDVGEGQHVADREVQFDITTCPGTLDSRTSTVAFARTGGNGTATVVLTGVNAAAAWLSVVEGHTLRRTVAVDLSGDNSDTVSVSLLSGDLQTQTVPQDDLVDIVDFSILASRFMTPVSECVSGDPEDCEYGADVTGDGDQDTADFTAMQINFFQQGDDVHECVVFTAPGKPAGLTPTTTELTQVASMPLGSQRLSGRGSITTQELTAMGARLSTADLNLDGVVDSRDIRAFAQRRGMTLLPSFESKLRSLEGSASAQPGRFNTR
ncbi:MAG: hypothetical protein DCC65_10970, partial [Planctomycetota bacterium]